MSGSHHYGYGAPSSASSGYHTSGHHTGALSRWNLEGSVGQEYMVGGDFSTPDEVTPIAGQRATELSMKDAFEAGMRYELGGSYALNPNRKLTLMGSYTHAEGKDVEIWNRDAPPLAINGKPSDYESYGVEAGLRQYFKIQQAPIVGSLRPYIEGRVGAAKVKDIEFENYRNTGGPLPGPAPVYDGGWVATGAGLVGVEVPVFKRATLGLETGIRYRSSLDGNRTRFGPGGAAPFLENFNNGSENWTVPVSLRGRYRF